MLANASARITAVINRSFLTTPYPSSRSSCPHPHAVSPHLPQHAKHLGPQEQQRKAALHRREIDSHPCAPLDLLLDVGEPVIEGDDVLRPPRGRAHLGCEEVRAPAYASCGATRVSEPP